MVKEDVVSCRVRQIHRHSSATQKRDFGNGHASKPVTSRLRAMNIRTNLSLSNRIHVDTETTEKEQVNNPRNVPSVEQSRQFMPAANMNHEIPRRNSASPHPVTRIHRPTSKCKEAGPRRRQASPCDVPRVIYARLPNAERPLNRPEDMRPRTPSRFDFEASISTFSSSRSTSSGSTGKDEDNTKGKNALKEMSASPLRNTREHGVTHLVESTSSQLNPNADEFVPCTEVTMPSSRRSTLASVFGRTSLKPNRTGGQRILRCLPNFPSPRVQVPTSTKSVADIVGPNHRFPFMTRLTPNITVLSAELKIFVVDLLSEEECNWILHHAEQHVENSVLTGTETWRKLFTHTQFDLPCCEVLPLRPMTNQLLIQIRQIIGNLFKARRAASRLSPRSWKEPHLLRYQKIPGKPEHTGMIMHFDGGHMTWQLMLSDHEKEYTGKSPQRGDCVSCVSSHYWLSQAEAHISDVFARQSCFGKVRC